MIDLYVVHQVDCFFIHACCAHNLGSVHEGVVLMFLVFHSQGYLISLAWDVERRVGVVGTVFIQIFPQQGKAVVSRLVSGRSASFLFARCIQGGFELHGPVGIKGSLQHCWRHGADTYIHNIIDIRMWLFSSSEFRLVKGYFYKKFYAKISKIW